MLRSLTLVIVAALALAACSSAASPSPAAQSAPPDSPAASGAGESPAAGGTDVAIAGFAFSPASVSVAPGSTVTWTNEDDAPHTVTFQGAMTDDSGSLAKGATFSLTFDSAGEYEYVCTIHPQMKGTVTVTG